MVIRLMNVAICLYCAVTSVILALIAVFLILRESSKEKPSEVFEKILAVIVIAIVVIASVCLVYSMVDYLLSNHCGCGYDLA